MSMQIFKAKLTYDGNYGAFIDKIVYVIEDNSTDLRFILDELGKPIECVGTDSYCDALSHALALKSGKGDNWSCELIEITFCELPFNIKKLLVYGFK